MDYAVILAGGSGTRLWPASRRTRPKQLLPLGDRPGESLLAATWRRLGPVCDPARIAVVTAADQAAQVAAALPGLRAGNLIAEPAGRNTAAALGLAAVHLRHRDPDAVIGAVPSDHHIADEPAFADVARRAFRVARERDVIATVGIVPTRAETGYGYLQSAGLLLAGDGGGPDESGAEIVARFVEKPDVDAAARYLVSGQHLWNAGMVFVRAARLLADIERFMPETARGLDAIAGALAAGGAEAARQVAGEVYPGLPPISIDYGVMERAEGVVTLRAAFGWSDVGSWAALADYRPADASGNVTAGAVIAHDASGNIAIADDGCAVAVVGVDDLIVVKSGDGVLVIPRRRAQDVRAVVEALAARGLDAFL